MYDVRNLKLWAYVRSSSPRPEVLIQQMKGLLTDAEQNGWQIVGTSQDMSTGRTLAAEGNPTAAGQCLAGGRCRENKSRILHGAARSGIFAGPRRCSALHAVRCELCAICKRTVTGIISTSGIQGAWTAVENKMKNKSSWFELNF